MSALHLPIKVRNTHEDKDLRELLKSIRHLIWPSLYVPDLPLTLQHLTMGTSNRVFKCTVDGCPEVAVVRINGESASLLVDRGAELEMIRRLSDSREGAHLYATFENGYVLEYIRGEVLQPEDLCNPFFYTEIAKKIARLHSIEQPQGACVPERRGVWKTIHKWLAIADEKIINQNSREHLATVTCEIAEYEAFLEKEYATTSLVFCHNDINHANILCNHKKPEEGAPSITFLDLEYAGFDYRGFDLGNHFCEWAGLRLEFERYPNVEQRSDFLRHYLQTLGSSNVEAELPALLVECERFAQVSHLLWHVWSLILAHNPNKATDFDYDLYAAKRWGEYLRRKAEVREVTYRAQNDRAVAS
jgi:ethanolamine kinase